MSYRDPSSRTPPRPSAHRIFGTRVGTHWLLLPLLVTRHVQITGGQNQKEDVRHALLLLPTSSSFHGATYRRVRVLPSSRILSLGSFGRSFPKHRTSSIGEIIRNTYAQISSSGTWADLHHPVTNQLGSPPVGSAARRGSIDAQYGTICG